MSKAFHKFEEKPNLYTLFHRIYVKQFQVTALVNLIHLYLYKYLETCPPNEYLMMKGKNRNLVQPLMSPKIPSGIEPKTEILFTTIEL